MGLQHDRIAELCEQLKLAWLASDWPALAQDAARGGASFADVLERMLTWATSRLQGGSRPKRPASNSR